MNSRMKEEEASSNSPFMEEASFRQASELVISLISTSYAIQSFPVKWQSIQDKLEQLNAGLTAAANNDLSSDSSAATKFLKSVMSTLNDIQSLTNQWSDETYSGGKLQLRSNLDVISSRLALHIKNLTEVFASGILPHSQAIVPSKPGVGACREDMRFYVKDLFSRLKIGDSDMRTQAITTLHEILCEDEKYAKIVALDTADGISLLVSFLEFGDLHIQEEAAGAVSVIAGFDSYKGNLVTAGVIAPLIQALEKGSNLGKERAARALRQLTQNADNGWSVSAHGGVTVLLKLCGDADRNSKLVGLVCGILRNLSSVEEIKRFMVEEGVVSVLAKLSRSKEEVSQIHAIELLLTLASEDESIKQNVVKEGITKSLMQLLDPSSPHSSKAREVAFRATELFCFCSPNSVNVLMSSRFLDWVFFFLKNGDISTQESALKAVSPLCELSDQYKNVLGDMGFMPELLRMLEAKSVGVREMAARLLCSLISVRHNRKRFVQNANNVNQIMRLLDPEEEKLVEKKLLLSLLMSLTDSNKGRRKIVASGYVSYLENLAEADVLDAKKITKKLSTKRFWGLLNGILT